MRVNERLDDLKQIFHSMMSFVNQSTVDRSTEDWLDVIEDRLQYDLTVCVQGCRILVRRPLTDVWEVKAEGV